MKPEELEAGATEAEAAPDRHRMEEAVLATVAKAGAGDQALWQDFFRVNLSRPGSDFNAIADAVLTCFNAEAELTLNNVRARLTEKKRAAISDAVLTGFLDGSKAVDVTKAREYIKTLTVLDRCRDAEAIIGAGGRALEDVRKAASEGNADPVALEAAYSKVVTDFLDAGTGKAGLTAEPPLARETLTALMDTLGKRRTSKRAGLNYGFPKLNDILSGMGPGLFVFGGITSCGKTTLMNQLADHVAAVEKVPVLFFAYEQGSDELLPKSLSRLAAETGRADSTWPVHGTDIGAITKSWLADWSKVTAAAEAYKSGAGRFLRIIDAGPDWTVDKIRLLAIKAKRQEDRRRAEAGTAEADAGKPSVLLVIDYLQIVPSGQDFLSVRERIDFVLTALRRLSRELQAPILVLVSLNRAGYELQKDGTGRISGPPSLAIFKESGGIEYSADAAFCMGEDEVASRQDVMHNHEWDKDHPEGRRIFLFCMKNRNGRRVTLEADFYPAHAIFTRIEESRGMTA